ncbi:MAG: large subunit ribosomal protein [Solirubrobacteraceae bacterium]|jgi:large subunit ribosomal protein L25|nr:large subunit ribosomal protein [Solirubrobacteraceae bacterium]
MAARTQSTNLTIEPRDASHSRATRRLRREGRVPGVLYGRGDAPLAFSVDARELRHALHGAGAVLELTGDGTGTTAAVLKDSQRHPVRGEVMHIDFLRVDLNQPIQAMVALHLVGAEEAPGVREGGVLEHVARELSVEALPSELPDAIEFDVSGMDINDTATVEQVIAPAGVTLLDDPETVVASLTPPRLEVEPEEEIETEVGVVGEGGDEAEGSADGGGGEASGDAGDADGE